MYTIEELRQAVDEQRWQDAEHEPAQGEEGYLSEEAISAQWERLRLASGPDDRRPQEVVPRLAGQPVKSLRDDST